MAAGDRVTTLALEVLRLMRDKDEELVYKRGAGRYPNSSAWIGYEEASRVTLLELSKAMAISLGQYSLIGEFEQYAINETGRELLAAEAELKTGGRK